MCFNENMDVGSLSGMTNVNTLQSAGNISRGGGFMGHTVTLGNGNVVNPSELGGVFFGGKPLSERHVEVVSAQR